MGLFANTTPPNLPAAPETMTAQYINQLTNVLRIFFTGISGVQQINVAKINLNLDTLPTEADVATLRAGDVYRDTTAANVLKVKV